MSDTHSLETGRLSSFKEWPHPTESLCSSESMARAGFFHIGTKDCVKCFVCNIKLDDWDPDTDEPWRKHIEFSPNCMFAQLGKEEADLTVEQWIDVFCAKAINAIDNKINTLSQNLD